MMGERKRLSEAGVSSMIPTRKPISGLEASNVGDQMAKTLMANWSLRNAKKIAREIKRVLDAETKRRKG